MNFNSLPVYGLYLLYTNFHVMSTLSIFQGDILQ